MRCSGLDLTAHLLQRLFSRRIALADVRHAIEYGQLLASYSTDKPYPSVLLLGFIDQQPLHVVVAQDVATSWCVVITAYRLDPSLWNDTFTQKIN